MQRFEIWSAGQREEVNRSGPVFHGAVYANTFDEACKKLARDNVWFGGYYHTKPKLFESEKDARKVE